MSNKIAVNFEGTLQIPEGNKAPLTSSLSIDERLMQDIVIANGAVDQEIVVTSVNTGKLLVITIKGGAASIKLADSGTSFPLDDNGFIVMTTNVLKVLVTNSSGSDVTVFVGYFGNKS